MPVRSSIVDPLDNEAKSQSDVKETTAADSVTLSSLITTSQSSARSVMNATAAWTSVSVSSAVTQSSVVNQTTTVPYDLITTNISLTSPTVSLNSTDNETSSLLTTVTTTAGW